VVSVDLDYPDLAINRAGLADALADFQRDLPHIDKGSEADAGTYKYRYADLAEVSDKVLPALGRHGLSWTTAPTFNDNGKFMLRYQLRHISGEMIEGWYPLPSADSKPQVLGSAITYARRYCLCAVTGVSPDEDDDGAAAQANAAATAEPDWDTAITAAVRGKDRAHLSRLWKKARELRPEDADLRTRIEQAAHSLTPKQAPPAAPAGNIPLKPRRDLERHLFALLGEGGITDSTTGRETRLLVLSRLCNREPVIGSLGDLTDTEVAGVNDTLGRWKTEDRLTGELAALATVEGASPAETSESESSTGTDGP
jgi:hypothetical protein